MVMLNSSWPSTGLRPFLFKAFEDLQGLPLAVAGGCSSGTVPVAVQAPHLTPHISLPV